MLRRCGLLAPIVAVLLSLVPSPAQAFDVNPNEALIGPVRYTETSGVQDSVYGASLMVIGDAYAVEPLTSDDTIVMTLTTFPTSSATIWLRKTNGIFPAAGATADDSLNFAHPSTTPARISSTPWFTLLSGSAVDDTVLKTNIAVNAPGTYSGTIIAYNGSSPTMSSSTIVQNTAFSFTTAGAPTSMTLSRTSVNVLADPGDKQIVRVVMLDSNNKPTQITSVDTIDVTSSDTTIATAAPAAIGAANFDDTLPASLGAANVIINGASAAGSATVTLTPRGTLPSTGVTAQSVNVTGTAMTTLPPGPFAITSPTDQVVKDPSSTDDTYVYDVNATYVTKLVVRSSGATPMSGVVAYLSTNSSSWVGLTAFDLPIERTSLTNGSANVPVITRTNSTGQAALILAWESVVSGGQITLRVGTGSDTHWTVINVVDPTLDSVTSPWGLVLAKTGAPIDFQVTLTDDFKNPYTGYIVSARSVSSSGFPVGPAVKSAPTDAQGITTLSVSPPDDSYVGNARINFTVTLASGLPYSALNPPQVLVTYSATGEPTSLTVTQGQSTPSPIGPTTTLTTYPHIVVPFSGTANTADGTPGTWNVATASGAPNGTMATFTPTVNPPTTVHASVGPGVFISGTPTSVWNEGLTDIWIGSGNPIYVFATKTGTHPITFDVGTLKTTALVKVSSPPVAAYNVAITPPEQTLALGAFGSVTVSVTDAFGNPVPNTTDDTGALTVSTSGEALLTGLIPSTTATTDDSGQRLLTVIAAKTVGEATVTAVPKTTTTVPAWKTGYVPPTGFPTPVLRATSLVHVGGTSTVPSISITGSRTKVQGKSGISVAGTAYNLDDTVTLTPWIKLAGQSEYSAGTAVITPAADGTFTWSRKTGKKAYVYIATADRAVRSNGVTIP